MEIMHVDSKNFEETVNSKEVVLVDFYATWCGPCKMLAPILEQVNEEILDNTLIAKLDIDNALDVAKQFGVMSVPTMIIFKNGKEIERLVGLRQKTQILEVLKNA